MGEVINLKDWRIKKQNEKDKLKQDFLDSLDNDKVKEKYKLKPKTIEERKEKITASIKRINDLMRQLEENNKP